MKNTSLSLCVLIIMAAATLRAQPESTYKRDGRQILITHYYDNGEVKEQGHYLKGQPNGKWIQYDEEGNVKTDAYYVNGKKEGKWFIWSDDRSYLIEATYKANTLVACHKWKIDEKNLLAGK